MNQRDIPTLPIQSDGNSKLNSTKFKLLDHTTSIIHDSVRSELFFKKIRKLVKLSDLLVDFYFNGSVSWVVGFVIVFVESA